MNYVVVTGASSGIGYETAKAFAARGFNVIAAARRTDRLEALRQEIAQTAPDVEVVLKAVDLSSEEDTFAFYDDVNSFNPLVWVNNAGRGNRGDITNTEYPGSLGMLHTNVTAVAILSTLFVRDHKDQPGAQLINVSSIGGYLVVPGATFYCATKFFVSALTEGIDQEMQQLGLPLRAKVLAPGSTATEFEQVANELPDYDYSQRARFNTAAEMAGFLMDLYDGDKTVGEMDFAEGRIKLSDPKHPFLGS